MLGMIIRLSFILCVVVPPTIVAALTNRTIDDQNGDPSTGFKPVYVDKTSSGSTETNGIWHFGPAYTGGWVQPHPDQLVQGTWHAITFDPGDWDVPPSVSLTFTGTAIYIFCVVPNTVTSGSNLATTLANMTFTLDNQAAGSYFHSPDATTDMMYNVAVYANSLLDNAEHTITMTAQPGVGGSYIAFDYAIYSVEESITTVGSTTATTPMTEPAGTSSIISTFPNTGTGSSSPSTSTLVSSTAGISKSSSLGSLHPASASPTSHSSAGGPGFSSTTPALPGSPVQPSSPANLSHPSHASGIGAIAGGVVGGVVVLVVLVILLWWCKHRRHRPHRDAMSIQAYTLPTNVASSTLPSERLISRPRRFIEKLGISSTSCQLESSRVSSPLTPPVRLDGIPPSLSTDTAPSPDMELLHPLSPSVDNEMGALRGQVDALQRELEDLRTIHSYSPPPSYHA